MGNSKKQKTAVQGFSFISLSLIDKSSFNPRKTFNENELVELSISIKEKGVIQPIVLRPIGQRFEVVCGDRRVRASVIAGIENIPACIKELSDEEAEEFAITENLQRKDVSPLEEARAFVRLVEKGKYDVSSMSSKFGKSESFIRNRMRLTQLRLEFCEMLEEERINIGVASVLANFAEELQETIFNEHFNENCPPYSSWMSFRPGQLQKIVEERYSTHLQNYQFLKDECKSCPFNSATFSLFVQEGEEGNCTRNTCLQTKNNDYFYQKAIDLQKENPLMPFCQDTTWATNSVVIERLVENGFDVERVCLTMDYLEEEPITPIRDDFENDGEYGDAMSNYEDELKEFKASATEREELLQNGKIKAYIAIKQREVMISYAEVKEEQDCIKNEYSEDGSNGAVEQRLTNSEIVKLLKRKTRNNELCNEKIIEDQRELVKTMDITDGDLSSTEWALAFMYMIRKMSEKTFKMLKLEQDRYNLNYADLVELTEMQKALVIRGFIIPNITEHYISSSNVRQENPLSAFLMQHAAENVEKIEKEWETAYQKRNDRLDERIEALQKEGKHDDVSLQEAEIPEEVFNDDKDAV